MPQPAAVTVVLLAAAVAASVAGDHGAGSDVATRDDQGAPDVSAAVEQLRAAAELAAAIANTELVPAALRGRPASVAAAIAYGADLGLPPLVALTLVDVVDGRPRLSSEGARARLLAAGHELEILELTGTQCVVRARRRGQQKWTHVGWTIDMARAAGLLDWDEQKKRPKRPNWYSYPRAMLAARACLEAARLVAPDVLHGLKPSPAAAAPPAAAEFDDSPCEAVDPEPAGELPERDVDQDPEPSTLIASQSWLTTMHTALTSCGVTGRDDRHRVIRDLLGVDFGSTTANLTTAQVTSVLADVRDCRRAAAAQLGVDPDDLPAADALTAVEALSTARRTAEAGS